MKNSNSKKRSKEQELLAEAREWESGKIGKQSVLAHADDEAMLDEVMELQMISIRLPASVIAKLKTMAKSEGVGYQPYTRQILIHHTQGEPKAGKLHDLEERLLSIERAVFKKTAHR